MVLVPALKDSKESGRGTEVDKLVPAPDVEAPSLARRGRSLGELGVDWESLVSSPNLVNGSKPPLCLLFLVSSLILSPDTELSHFHFKTGTTDINNIYSITDEQRQS